MNTHSPSSCSKSFKVNNINRSTFNRRTQVNQIAVRKGGLPPLKLQFFDVSWVVMQLERG